MTSVNALRRTLKRRRRMLPAEQRRIMNQQLCGHLLSSHLYRNATAIAAYLPFGGEPDLMPLIRAATRDRKQLFLPRIRGYSRVLRFLSWRPGDPLIRNHYGIPEPLSSANERAPIGIDLILLPLVGFDRNGNRIGMGAGYYDCTFGFRLNRGEWQSPKLIGTAWSFQECEDLPRQPWDVPVDATVTEQGWR